jgi:hypothetical protein
MTFDNVKTGDTVIVCSGRIGVSERPATVTRTTEKQIIVAGDRFWKKNGDCVGSTRRWIVLPKAEVAS